MSVISLSYSYCRTFDVAIGLSLAESAIYLFL